MIQNKVSGIFKQRSIAIIQSAFYGCIAASIFHLLFSPNTGPDTTFAATLLTGLLCFASYYYQKHYCFKLHHDQGKGFNLADIAPLGVATWFIIPTLNVVQIQQVIALSVLTGLNLIYHNHGAHFILRKIPVLKNLTVALSWVILLFYTHQPLSSWSITHHLIALDFVILFLLQSLLSDHNDRSLDIEYQHFTWINTTPPDTLRKVSTNLLLTSGLITLLAIQINHRISWSLLITTFILYILYSITLMVKCYGLKPASFPVCDLILLMKAILWSVFL